MYDAEFTRSLELARLPRPLPDEVVVTGHAARRFQERISKQGDPADGFRELAAHLADAVGLVRLTSDHGVCRDLAIHGIVLRFAADNRTIVTVFRVAGRSQRRRRWVPTVATVSAMAS